MNSWCPKQKAQQLKPPSGKGGVIFTVILAVYYDLWTIGGGIIILVHKKDVEKNELLVCFVDHLIRELRVV